MAWQFIQKQIILGSSSSGKSSLLVRLTDDRFLTASEPTIGVEFGSRLVEIEAGAVVKLQIWDTAGQESFRSITRSYYRGAGGALLVFDLTHRPSFLACKSWLEDLRRFGEEDLLILLVGNKLDLIPAEGPTGTGGTRGVSVVEAEEWAQENGLIGYVETSAKLGSNVESAFNQLTRSVHEAHQASLANRNKSSSGSSFPINLSLAKAKTGCC